MCSLSLTPNWHREMSLVKSRFIQKEIFRKHYTHTQLAAAWGFTQSYRGWWVLKPTVLLVGTIWHTTHYCIIKWLVQILSMSRCSHKIKGVKISKQTLLSLAMAAHTLMSDGNVLKLRGTTGRISVDRCFACVSCPCWQPALLCKAYIAHFCPSTIEKLQPQVFFFYFCGSHAEFRSYFNDHKVHWYYIFF